MANGTGHAVRRQRYARALAAEAPSPLASRPKYYSRAVGKALELLDALRKSSTPLSLNQLAEGLKLVKSSVLRIVCTLEAAGYLKRNSERLYELSPDVIPLLGKHFATRVVQAAEAVMAELSREFRETVSLGVLMDNHIEVVAVTESPELVKMGSVVGRILPPHASSLGKSIAAFQPEQDRENLLRKYGLAAITPKTITDEVSLREMYKEIRTTRYSTDMEETALDGCCFAAPIFTGSEVLAGVSASLPRTRLQGREEQVIAAVQAAAQAISKTLSAKPR